LALVFAFLKNKRCLVPARGFYEGKKDGTRKIPYYIHLKDSPTFTIAGHYDIGDDALNEAHPTYTIITTGANEIVAPLHDRMPVILRRDGEKRWITGDSQITSGIFSPVSKHRCINP
jgi:putative SOS response-associated peptidase YedK